MNEENKQNESLAPVPPAAPPQQAPNASAQAAVDPLADKDQRGKVEYMAQRVLADKNANTPETAVSGRDIFAAATALFQNAGVPENTFKQYLSKAVRDSRSQINCLGKKQGYYLSAAAKALDVEQPAELAAEAQASSDEGRREKEKLLHDVLLNWLIEQEYRSKITAAGRGNGQWGNPDISGIACDESFGSLWLEVATIEVKLSDRDWKKWIFEAISHRRFANRSYFAFAHQAELIKKLDSELRYFSELYQVGILVVAMEKGQYEDLQAGNLKEPVDDEDVDIIELYSAPYTPVQPRYQKEYLETLRITSTPDVARWGEGLEDSI